MYRITQPLHTEIRDNRGTTKLVRKGAPYETKKKKIRVNFFRESDFHGLH
jgi:hypothetical protein